MDCAASDGRVEEEAGLTGYFKNPQGSRLVSKPIESQRVFVMARAANPGPFP